MALRDVIGQDRAINILGKTLGRGRLPSAYLFTGESGIGKRLTAINLAKSVNCMSPVPFSGGAEDACDACPSCRKIDAGIHPDVLMVTPSRSEIRVDEIRAVEDALSLRPFEGKRKVVIIDDAEAMNQPAANAFLKTLEEPPDLSLIILVASNPDLLPETVRSRCSRVRFTPLSDEDCGLVLGRASGFAQPGEDTLRAAVRLSMGRPGFAASGDPLKEQEWFLDLLNAMVGGAPVAWADADEMERWLDLANVFFRDLVVAAVTGDNRELLDPRIGRQSLSQSEVRQVIEAYEKVGRIRGLLGFHLNKAITWNYAASLFRPLAGRASLSGGMSA